MRDTKGMRDVEASGETVQIRRLKTHLEGVSVVAQR